MSERQSRLLGTAALLTSLIAAVMALAWIGPSQKSSFEPAQPHSDKTERPSFALRGVFGQDATMETPAKIDGLLDCMEAVEANVLYAPVAFYGQAFYHSGLLPHRDFDSWAYLVPQAHARGIEVHAWVYAAYLGWQQQPSWNVRHEHPDVTDNWLDFSQPAAREFIGDLVVEVVDVYQADGVLLDYIRWGYWWQEAGLSPDDISLAVQGIYERLDSRVPLTAAVSAEGPESQARGQDWHAWLKGGYIDFVEPMAYVGDDQLHKLLDEWQKAGLFPDQVVPILETGDGVLDQIDKVYQAGATGVVLFDDVHLCSDQALIESLNQRGW